MSYRDPSGGYPPQEIREQESQYPPPPEGDDHARAYHHRVPNNNVKLPSISPYESQYAQQSNGYTTDPRYQPDPYRPPPPQDPYPQDPYRGAPPPDSYRDNRGGYPAEYRAAQPQMAFSQSAPRQRTAIACRYCRRRKIRCSGFEQSPQGRCTNCQRFDHECIFTPVSSQAQAFVPAHAVYPGMRNMGVGPDGRPRPMAVPQGTQLYGAHGQPLSIPAATQQAPMGSPYAEYAIPSPTNSYNSFTEERPGESSRKRPQPEPHPSVLPPPIPGQPSFGHGDNTGRRPAVEDDLRLPPVTPNSTAQGTSNYSPGSSTSSHSNLQPPSQGGLPSLSRTPPPRSSPGEGRADPMSLGNIMERRPDTEIDRSMLGRLDRKN
ncbi:hypothetical protein ACMFMG_007288 [Clarireedia jacksonii]